MSIVTGTKRCVNIFKLRYYGYMCIFVCMTKHSQISYGLNEILYFLLEGAKPLQWCCSFGTSICISMSETTNTH